MQSIRPRRKDKFKDGKLVLKLTDNNALGDIVHNTYYDKVRSMLEE